MTAAKSATTFPPFDVCLEGLGESQKNCISVADSLSEEDNSRSGAGDSLGSPATGIISVASFPSSVAGSLASVEVVEDFSLLDIPGADASDDVLPFVVESTPDQIAEAAAFFEAAKAAESKAQSDRSRRKSAVFSVMQYRENPATGEVMLSQEQLDQGLAALGNKIYKYAYIWHPLDRVVDVDEATGEATCCGLKGLHLHLVIWFHAPSPNDRPSLRMVSDAFQIPSAKIVVPNERAAQEGNPEYKGAGSAERAFFDFAEYLVHESRSTTAIAGVTQPSRTYCTDATQRFNPGKYQYGRGRVVANFDFSVELDRHMAGRYSAATGLGSLSSRKRKLRRAVMEGMTLDEAELTDQDAFADDLPRLSQLNQRYVEKVQKGKLDGLGRDFYKSLVVASSPTGQGKDVLLEILAGWLVRLAKLAGLAWTIANPAGKNASEGIGQAAIVHHEDARFTLLPNYDEALRHFDPNRTTESAARFRNLQPHASRVSMLSTSLSMTALALTFKKHRSEETLAESFARNGEPLFGTDVDEFLRRIGWVVEVRRTDNNSRDLDEICKGLVVAISKVNVPLHATPRREVVIGPGGAPIGKIQTKHEIEPVAVIKGAEDAARFLALRIIEERNQDVLAAIPPEALEDLHRDHLAIEAAAAEEQKAAAEEEDRLQQEAEQSRLLAEHFERQAVVESARLAAEKQAVLDQKQRQQIRDNRERQEREKAEKAATAREAKAEKVRANGFLLK